MTHENRGRRTHRTSLARRLAGTIGALALVATAGAVGGDDIQAQSPPATLQFVNAYNVERFTAVVDPAGPSPQEIDLKESRTISRIDLTPGDSQIDIYAGQSTSGSPFTSRTVTAESEESLAFVVHPDATGSGAVTSVFRDDTSVTGSATTRVVVRHVAQAGAVDVELSPSPASSSSNGTTESFSISNGQQGVIDGVDASEGVLYQLEITPTGATSPLITDTEIQLTPGEVTIIYVAGSPPTGESSSDPTSLLQSTLDVGALPPPTVNLVNGFSMGQYVFYVDGTQNASIESLRRNGVLQGLGEGTVTVDAYLNSSAPGSGTPAATRDITVCDGRSYDLAIYADATGATQLTLFENDVTAPAIDRTRFTIRHIGQYGPLDFDFGGSGENPGAAATAAQFTLSNGEEYIVDDAFINDYLVNAFNPGTTAGPVTQNPDLEGEGAATQLAYVMGTPPGATMPISEYFPGAEAAVIPNAPAPAEPGTECGSSGTSTGGGGTTDPNPMDVSGNFFTAVDPDRVLDTRTNVAGAAGYQLAGESVNVPMAGVGEIADDATAVVVNIAATATSGRGFVSALPEPPSGTPTTASLTFGSANAVASSNATVPLNADGSFTLYTSADAHLIVDVLGYYSPTDVEVSAGRFVPLTPDRLFDTRTAAAPSGINTAGSSITVPTAGEAGIPETGVEAVVMNLTVTGQDRRGFVTADERNPESSEIASVNYMADDGPVGNLVVVQLSSSDDITITSSSDVHLIGDVVGYFTDDTAAASSDGLFELVSPQERVFDTRSSTKVSPSNDLVADVVSEAGLNIDDVLAVSMTVTGVQAEARAFIQVSPEGTPEPVATLNLLAGQLRSNATYVGVSDTGTVLVEASQPVHVIGDLTGYFTTAA